MTHVSILTITATHDFDKVVHHSCHVSHTAAQAYADNTVLPGLRDREEPEWHDCYDVDINTMRVQGAV